MAPATAPKINPTLRTGVGSTAGERDGRTAAAGSSMAVKRQKTIDGETPRVSMNLDGRKRRVNPLRLATAKASAGGSPATAGADGSPGRGTAATTIPSNNDDEVGPLRGDTGGSVRSLNRCSSGSSNLHRLGTLVPVCTSPSNATMCPRWLRVPPGASAHHCSPCIMEKTWPSRPAPQPSARGPRRGPLPDPLRWHGITSRTP